MPTPCPACQFPVKNAPECPRCGHQLNDPPAFDFAKGLTRALLEELVDEDPLVARAMDLIFKLEDLAPEYAAWRELPPTVRGPQPPIAVDRQPAVAELMQAMLELSDAMTARDERQLH